MKDTGIVPIHGKAYQTVAYRIGKFREIYGYELSLISDVLEANETVVRMKAMVVDPTGRVLATGHAEEYRNDGKINKTAALENAETSCIGRALAAFGLGGTEFASADEVARVVSGQKAESGAEIDELVSRLREAALSGSKALQDAFKALPATTGKKLAWDQHGNSLKAAAKEADLAGVE
jgi:hypothetical protein